MNEDRDIWFPAKRYGWGWGPPVKWQGWAVLAAFTVGVVAIGIRFPPHRDPFMFLGLVILASVLLSAICWWKGERPRWRWGGDKP